MLYYCNYYYLFYFFLLLLYANREPNKSEKPGERRRERLCLRFNCVNARAVNICHLPFEKTLLLRIGVFIFFLKITKCFENYYDSLRSDFIFVSNNDNIKYDINRRLPLQSRGDHEKNFQFIFWRCAIKYTINAFVRVFFSFMSTRNIFIRTRVRNRVRN